MFNFIMYMIVQIGAINWLCIGLFQFDFIAGIFGSQAHFVSRFLYMIIGLAGVYMLIYGLVKKGNLNLMGNTPKEKKDSKKKTQKKKKEEQPS